jgi:hypothetical protein
MPNSSDVSRFHGANRLRDEFGFHARSAMTTRPRGRAEFHIGQGHVGVCFVGGDGTPTNIPTFLKTPADAKGRLWTAIQL